MKTIGGFKESLQAREPVVISVRRVLGRVKFDSITGVQMGRHKVRMNRGKAGVGQILLCQK